MKFLDRLLSPKNLAKATEAMSKGELIALDKYLIDAAKKGGSGGKLLESMQNIKMLPNRLVNPKSSAVPLLLGIAGIQPGGISGKPFALSLLNTAKRIDPVLSNSLNIRPELLNPAFSISKPSAALTTAPFSYAAKGVDALAGTGIAESMAALHPAVPVFGAGLATAMLAPKIARGAGKLLSRAGRQRRLNLLQKGIAPKTYKAIAKQHGFR